MPAIEKPATIAVDSEVQAAVDRVLRGARDPEAMRRAAERVDRMREVRRIRSVPNYASRPLYASPITML